MYRSGFWPVGDETYSPESQTVSLGIPPAVIILTVNDPRLVRMQHEATRLETLLERRKQLPGLGLRATVSHSVIRIARPWMVGTRPVHPCVKHIMEKQVGQVRCNRWLGGLDRDGL